MDMREQVQSLLEAVPPPHSGDPDAALRRARRRRRARIGTAGGGAVAALLVVVLVTGLVNMPPAPLVDQRTEHSPEDILGRTFASVEVIQEGQPRELVNDARIRMTFNPDRVVTRRDEQGNLERVDADATLTWRAGCNHFMSLVDVHDDRLTLRPLPALEDGEGPGVSQTLRACSSEGHEQDDWLLNFFVAAPRWHINDTDRLTLAIEDTVIIFEERPYHPHA